MEKLKIQLLSQKPSSSNCIKIRNTALQQAAPRLAAECDDYMSSALSDMLHEEDFLSLPRIQVNVDVSDRPAVPPGSESVMIPVEDVVPSVVRHLQQLDTTSLLEEKVIELSYMQHLSIFADQHSKFNKSLSPILLSPEKLYSIHFDQSRNGPSPARKLILPESSEEEEEDNEEVFKTDTPWKIIAIHRMSEIGAICVVDRSSSLVVLNITLMLSKVTNKLCPVSPTTGLPFTNGNAMISQMCEARSGFAAVPTDVGLISMGGFNREGVLADMELFDIHKNQWEVIGEMKTKRARFGVTECGGDVYAIGGSDGRSELGSTEVYVPNSNTWRSLESRMITPRSCFGAASLKGRIYMAGGTYYSIPLKSAEVFDLQTNRWRSLPSMGTTRNGLSLASCGGKVYAIGGQSSGWRCLKTVECYDPVRKSWTNVASMKRPRRNATVLTINDEIYVFGGYDGSTALNQVEVYDPTENQWNNLPSMAAKRSGACAVHVHNSIYVTGGFSGSVFLNSVERYDMVTKQWSSYV